MSEPQFSMSLGQTDAAVFVRIDGPATRSVAPAFTSLCDRCREHDDRPLHVDLSRCERIDSTFAGCLVGQSVKANQASVPGFVLACPSPACSEAIEHMGLDRLLKVDATAPPAADTFTIVAREDFSPEKVIETVIAAHEQLAETSEANAKAFGPIAAAFRADLERKRGQGQGTGTEERGTGEA